MMKVITLETSRDCYDKRDAMPHSLSVGELIDILNGYDEDTKVIFLNDGGYTYGIISADSIIESKVESYEEERLREQREDLEDDIFTTENEIADLEKIKEDWDEDDEKEYNSLQAELENLKKKLAEMGESAS